MIILRHANAIGSVAVAGALALLLIGLIFRTPALAYFVVVALWGALPYVIMLFVHRRLRPDGWSALVSLVASLLIGAFGIWFTLDALFTHFGPKSAGIGMFILSVYQLPAVAIAVLACLVAKRTKGRGQPPNSSLNADAPQAGRWLA